MTTNNADQNPIEIKMQELIDKLIEKHCINTNSFTNVTEFSRSPTLTLRLAPVAYDDDVMAIYSLIMYIRSIDNEEEVLEKINTAILIPYSKMYVRDDWADTDWDWLTGQTKYDEISRWKFTDEERESIRISQETIRNLISVIPEKIL